MAGRLMSVLLFVLLLGGCASAYEVVPPGRHQIENAYTVDSQISWSRITQERIELWTVDGPFLEGVRFYEVGSGQSLIAQGEDEQRLQFEPKMRAGEVMEFVVDSLAVGGVHDIKTLNLRPAKFGVTPGFRFELQFLTPDGLLMKGMALYATIDDTLYLILYTAPAIYYFEKYEDTVEHIFNSVELI